MEPDEIPSLKDNLSQILLQKHALEANYSYLSKLHIKGRGKNVKAENRSDNINIRKKYRVQGKCSYCDTGSYFALIKGKIHKNAVTLIYLTQ